MGMTSNFQPSDQNPMDNTYISGYGFVSSDPRKVQDQHLKKTIAIISIAMLSLWLLPQLFSSPIAAVLNSGLTLLSGSVPQQQLVLLSTLAQEFLDLCLYLISLLIPSLILRLTLQEVPPNEMLFSSPSKATWHRAIPLTLAVVALTAVGSQMVNDLLFQFRIIPLTPNNMLPGNGLSLIFYIIRVLLLPAILEEYLFRGLILHALRQYGDTFSVVLSAALYGMIQSTVTRNLSGFVFGLVLGYFVLRTGSVRTSIFCHLSASGVGAVILLMQHFLPNWYELVEIVLFICLLIIGMIVFVWSCTKDGHAFILSDGNNKTSTAHKLRLCLRNGAFVLVLLLWVWKLLQSIQIFY